VAAPPLTRPPDHPLARALWPHLLADAQQQIRLAIGVALLADAGADEEEIARRTGADPAELWRAWRQLERAVPDLSRELRGRRG
jgi:hypothetical protein